MNTQSTNTPSLSHGSKDVQIKLNFQPHRAWPISIPAISWNGLQLCGFESEIIHKITFCKSPAENLENFIQTFHDLYPTLSLVECANLYFEIRTSTVQSILNSFFSLETLWLPLLQKYQIRFSSSLIQTLIALKETPLTFQEWCAKKDVGARDLSSLQIRSQVLNPENYFLALHTIAQFDFGKTDGIKSLEICLELLAQEFSADAVFFETKSAQKWLQSITEMRFPLSSQFDKEQAYKVAQLSWPIGTHVKWIRLGDMGAVEIKMQVTSPIELKKIISGLQKVEEQMQKPENIIWAIS